MKDTPSEDGRLPLGSCGGRSSEGGEGRGGEGRGGRFKSHLFRKHSTEVYTVHVPSTLLLLHKHYSFIPSTHHVAADEVGGVGTLAAVVRRVVNDLLLGVR